MPIREKRFFGNRIARALSEALADQKFELSPPAIRQIVMTAVSEAKPKPK
jgi:hypothetical protein